jgi:hypothetical protein
MSLQLVGATAVLVFATSTVSTIAFVSALASQWDALLHTMPNKTWDGFYYPVFSLPVFYIVVAVLSAAMFGALLYASRGALVKIAIAYLVAMLAALTWRIYTHLPGGGVDGLRMLAPTAKVYLGLRIGYAIWLVSLVVAVLPNNSLKRTAAGWLR